MKLSVIIVNYNVEFFLEQCLNSCLKSLEGISGEIFVVDNNSIDGSVALVKSKFPSVILIDNKDNLGFSKANNQAMRIAKGEYVLLLNPDTIVEEDTFKKVIDFMDSHPDAGGLGVRMLDGKGKFLPESKRGLPTPVVAFYKIFGFSKLFPKSKRFGHYHLGYLDEFKTHEIEILSGAFMLMRKKTLDKVGLLDEAFFMYGEDIDLSYRIILRGYKNYYYPETRIIHYKGESTKKSSVNYVFVFYRAMIIFAQKHFSQKNAKLFSFLINSAIYFRAGIAILARFIKKAILSILDILIIVLLLIFWSHTWEEHGTAFPKTVLQIFIPIYTAIWIISSLYAGIYDKPTRLIRFVSGTAIGTAIILIMYALLPKDWQFSRLFILIGAATVLLYFILSRLIIHLFLRDKYPINGNKNKKFVIVGSQKETLRVKQLLEQTNQKIDKIEFVSNSMDKFSGAMGIISQLDQIVYIHKIDEVIFCAKDTTAQVIIEWMSRIDSSKIDFKIAQPDSIYIIGSNSIDTSGELYMLEINSITKQNNRRSKRTFDFLMSTILLLLTPFICWFYNNKKQLAANLFKVIIGKKSIVGYYFQNKEESFQLPKIKLGILFPQDLSEVELQSKEAIQKLNLIYARDYSLMRDMHIFHKAWKKLDR